MDRKPSPLSCVKCGYGGVCLSLMSPTWPARCVDGETRSRTECARCRHIEYHSEPGQVPREWRREDNEALAAYAEGLEEP